MNILLINGATRLGNRTARAAKFIQKYFNEKHPEIELRVVSPLDFPMDYDAQDLPEYQSLVENAHAFIILFPEYNHGYPGKLKSLLDSTYAGYNYKHVLISATSDGPFGGARGVENISPILKALKLYMSKDDLLFPKVQELLTEEGKFLDDIAEARATKVLEDFLSRVA